MKASSRGRFVIMVMLLEQKRIHQDFDRIGGQILLLEISRVVSSTVLSMIYEIASFFK